MTKSSLTAAAVLVGAAAVWWLWTPPPSPRAARPAPPRAGVPSESSPAAATTDTARREAVAAALRRAPGVPADSADPPASLRDTDVDGALAVDADGNLVVAPALRRFFEYFFVASGEESDIRIRERIEDEIAARASGDAQRQALELLDRYLAYRERGRSIADAASSDDLVARAEALRRLRRESFGEQIAAALFADEDALYRVAVEQRRIANDPTLSDAERAAQLADLEAALPQAERNARAAVTGPLRLARDEAALRDAGGTAEEIRALREQAVGSEAADRLAVLDQRRAEWQARVDAYRRERAAIDQNAQLDAEQREVALGALRASHFSAAELARIRALDRIE